jgi:hypothetical protein
MNLIPGESYFGTDLCANQGASRYKYFSMLADLVRKETPALVLEVGAWAGNSLVAWDLAFNKSASLVVVDAWEPYFDGYGTSDLMHAHSIMNAAASSGEIFRLFMHNIQACGIDKRVLIQRGDSRTILPELAKEYAGKFDLIFIDGDHRYDVAVCDVRNAVSLIREGGILCGDDLEAQLYELNGLNRHKMALVANADYIAHVETGQGLIDGYHPGVTQAVAEIIGPVSCFEGLWAVKRTSNRWECI